MDTFYDKSGKEIKEFDVLKVFHFTGARRKKHYMYKWVRRDQDGHLCIQHLNNDQESLVRMICLGPSVFEDTEIVQSYEEVKWQK